MGCDLDKAIAWLLGFEEVLNFVDEQFILYCYL